MSASRFSRSRGTPKGADPVGDDRFAAAVENAPPPDAVQGSIPALAPEETPLLPNSASNADLPAQAPSRLQTPTSSRRTSPRAPQTEPPPELLEHHRAVRTSPRTTETEQAPSIIPPTASRENSRHLQLVDHPSQSSLSDKPGNAAGEHRVQIVTPHSRRDIPALQLSGSSSSRLEAPHIDVDQDEAPIDPEEENAGKQSPTGVGDAKVVKQDARGQLDRMERLRQLHHACCFSLVHSSLCFFKLGYNIADFLRSKTFSDANKGLDLRRDAAGLTVSIIVRDTETFQSHITGLIKPLVRVHAVAMDTGLYLPSLDKLPTPPVMTRAELSRQTGSKAVWDQEIVLDAHYYDIVTENSLLLFEILDDKPSLSLDKHTRSKHCYLKKVAWGFLLPVGSHGQMNVGFGSRQAMGGAEKVGQTPRTGASATSARAARESRPKTAARPLPPPPPPSRPFHQPLRIQLHRYRRYDGVVGLLQRSLLAWPALDPRYLTADEAAFPHAVPSVYLQWRLLRKMPIDGAFLNVSVGPKVMRVRTPRGETAAGRSDGQDTEGSQSPRSMAQPEADCGGLYERLCHRKKRRAKSREEASLLRSTALRRLRRADEPCAIPHRFLRRLDVGPDGAMAVSFSHSGHLLAIAARFDTHRAAVFAQDVVYSLVLYDTDTDEEVWAEYIAHHSVIYDIRWSKTDRYLLTAAGDGTCKVWDLAAFCPLLDAVEAGRRISPLAGDGSPRNDQARPAPRILQVLSLGTAQAAYCAVFQDFHPAQSLGALPRLHSLASPLAGGMLAGSSSLADPGLDVLKADVPRIIVGCADGRLRVFEHNRFAGYLSVPSDASTEAAGRQDLSPHDAQINALVIDERSKYLLSGDANGDIFAWRLDRSGWYQLLRQFKRHPAPHSVANPLFNAQTAMLEPFDHGSVLSMLAHPHKTRSLLLVHSRQPATLKVVSLSTYKPVSYCEGYTGIPQTYLVREDSRVFSAGVFFRAMFSADGRYIIACNAAQGPAALDARHAASPEAGSYRLLVWDTYTGHQMQTPLSSLSFPYPVRAIAWHPHQHLIAVTMVGEGAAVVLYCADADGSLQVVDRKAELQSGTTSAAALAPPAPAEVGQSAPRASRDKPSQASYGQEELNYSLLDNSAFIQGKASAMDASAAVLMGTRSDAPPSMATRPLSSSAGTGSELDREERLNRAREMLDRIRHSRAKGSEGQT